jgi:hypothetical protein
MTNAPQYTREVGRKFHADGSPRRFPGNTIICFVYPQSPIGQAASAFQEDLRRQTFGAKFVPLPPSSFHMTVMELLCDQVREPERWSSQLALDVALTTTDAFFQERVPAISTPSRLTMSVDGLLHRGGLMFTLQPADATVAAALRDYRAAVAAATGVRFPDHDSYGFHISLAYRLLQLDAAEEEALSALCDTWATRLRSAGATISLDPPMLTFFEDMFRFSPEPERPA